MKLGIDIRELEKGKRTGIGRYLRNFIAYMLQSRPEHQLCLYGNQHTEVDFEAGNAVVRLEEEGITLWWDQAILPKFAAEDGIDVFLSPYVKGPVRIACPLVTTVHDLLFLVFPEYSNWRQKPRQMLAKRMARWVGKRADLILTDSEYSRGDIRALLGLTGEKIQVLPMGVDENYRPVRDRYEVERVCAAYAIAPPYIFYLGNFKPHKNVQGLIRAFAHLPEAVRRQYPLVLGGRQDAWQSQRRQLVRELDLDDTVHFIGAVADADMPALYSGAELFVFPSFYEGFGLPPLEAMACGTAVVASSRTSIPEVVGEAGCLVDPEDSEVLVAAMSRILEDGQERCRLEEAGLERAAQFRSVDLCRRQMEMLERVAEVGR